MGKADLAGAAAKYPSTKMGTDGWVEAFDENPDIMYRILGDIYDVVKAEEEREAGIRAMGRRPGRSNVSLIDFQQTVFRGGYSMDPFPQALSKLIDGRWSLRGFAMRVPVSAGWLSKLMNGIAEPDFVTLERIADAAKVHPSYFVEWRAMYISQTVETLLRERPNMSVQPVREVRDLVED